MMYRRNQTTSNHPATDQAIDPARGEGEKKKGQPLRFAALARSKEPETKREQRKEEEGEEGEYGHRSSQPTSHNSANSINEYTTIAPKWHQRTTQNHHRNDAGKVPLDARGVQKPEKPARTAQ